MLHPCDLHQWRALQLRDALESRHDWTSGGGYQSLPQSMGECMNQEKLYGYVRSGCVFVEVRMSLEVIDEQQRTSVLTLETDDGPVYIGLNRQDAMNLQQMLQLFLEDRPADRDIV